MEFNMWNRSNSRRWCRNYSKSPALISSLYLEALAKLQGLRASLSGVSQNQGRERMNFGECIGDSSCRASCGTEVPGDGELGTPGRKASSIRGCSLWLRRSFCQGRTHPENPRCRRSTCGLRVRLYSDRYTTPCLYVN